MRQWKEGIGYRSLPSLHYRYKSLLEIRRALMEHPVFPVFDRSIYH